MTATTRRLLRTRNNAYDMLLLVEGETVIGAWDWTPATARQYANPGDLTEWEATYPDGTRVEDYGAVVGDERVSHAAPLAASDDNAAVLGQPYTADMVAAYDWLGCWPLVSLAPDGRVTAVEEVTDGEDPDLVLVDVVCDEAGVYRVVRAGVHASDAMAWRHELVDAGIVIEGGAANDA